MRVALTNELIRLGGPQIHSVMERSAERTCAEVGKILGCSKEQVRLLEHTALIKLMRKFKELQK